jgi:hypothetical protein
MGVIDEEGRLFGVVNVIDLLVVAVVVATLVAGAAFVLADDPAPPEERYLTVVLDERPAGTAPALDGDSAPTPRGTVELGRTSGRITDMYVAPTSTGGTVTVARVRVNVSAAVANRTTDRRLVTDERTYRVGEAVVLRKEDSTYEGYLRAVGRNGDALPTERANATVVARLPEAVADRVRPGTTQRLAGREVAQVVSVERRTTPDDRVRVEATVSLRVLADGGDPLYGTQHVRPGAEVTVAPDGYEFTGTVTEVT